MWQIQYISWPANTMFYWQFLQITETASLWIANSEIIGHFCVVQKHTELLPHRHLYLLKRSKWSWLECVGVCRLCLNDISLTLSAIRVQMTPFSVLMVYGVCWPLSAAPSTFSPVPLLHHEGWMVVMGKTHMFITWRVFILPDNSRRWYCMIAQLQSQLTT